MLGFCGSSKTEAVVLVFLAAVVISTPFTQPLGDVSDARRCPASRLGKPRQKAQLLKRCKLQSGCLSIQI